MVVGGERGQERGARRAHEGGLWGPKKGRLHKVKEEAVLETYLYIRLSVYF